MAPWRHPGQRPAADQGGGEFAGLGQGQQRARRARLVELIEPDAWIDGRQHVDQPAGLFAEAGPGLGTDAVAPHGSIAFGGQVDLQARCTQQAAFEREQRPQARQHPLRQLRPRQPGQQALGAGAHFLAPVVERGFEEGFVVEVKPQRQRRQQGGALFGRLAFPGRHQCLACGGRILAAPGAQDGDALLERPGVP